MLIVGLWSFGFQGVHFYVSTFIFVRLPVFSFFILHSFSLSFEFLNLFVQAAF